MGMLEVNNLYTWIPRVWSSIYGEGSRDKGLVWSSSNQDFTSRTNGICIDEGLNVCRCYRHPGTGCVNLVEYGRHHMKGSQHRSCK